MKNSSDLKSRILLTLLLLVVYRLGTFIPVPGIDAEVMKNFFSSDYGSMFGMLNMFSGGALSRMSIFALNIMPYITASIIVQLMSSVYKGLENLKKEGEYGRSKINQYTRYLTVFLSFVQAVGVYYALHNMETSAFISDSRIFFWTTVFSLTCGTILLMWFGERITAGGIGNGISLLIFVGIASSLPSMFARMLELSRSGVYSWFFVVVFIALFFAFIGFIAFVEKIQRKIKIQYPNRGLMKGSGMQDSSFLPLKLNMSGVIPPIFASSILMFPSVIFKFYDGDLSGVIAPMFARGGILYLILFAVLIIFFCFFYTSLTFNTKDIADNLKKSNCFILGIRPGSNTAEYLDKIISRITVIGSLYLLLVCIIPEVLISRYSLPLTVGGTGMLIIVNVILDTITQVQSHLFTSKYSSMNKRKIRVRS